MHQNETSMQSVELTPCFYIGSLILANNLHEVLTY
jgi:hypothetical protein